ncbi:alpha/beta hydrolase [uncultured Pelagimonas sp.]|uniref:alpha/beta fold hydrolase n=1 Tax=uncultured Pelagimonas sp. TaxID=1618102 RepID=UPI002628DED9|nr:alpha/beta hydrolase [uncultured Pelagimonas sp.]
MMFVWLVVAAGLFSAGALPVYRELKRQPKPKATPMAQLSQGATRYRWYGDPGAPVAVCVHGLSTPSVVFDELAQELVLMGYRVLTYDLYGRGSSSTPKARQTPDFFAKQFNELMANQDIANDITLIGYSMGGVIATHLAAQNPHRFREVILLAPAGMTSVADRPTRWAMATPLLGDWAFHLIYPRHMSDSLKRDAESGTKAVSILDEQLAELGTRGFVGSVLSSLRGTLRHKQEATHRKLAQTNVPVTAIWGREDTVIPLRALGTLTQWNRNARQVVIDGAGHGLPHTHAVEIADALADGY